LAIQKPADRARATRTVRANRAEKDMRPGAPLVGDHALENLLVRCVRDYALMQLLLALVRLGSQDVAAKRVIANDFARTRLLEPLGRTFVCLELRHKYSWIFAGKTFKL
jgi:hypothetical protein